ncbi:MAG: GNAT family N-acetyltransferase [Clostridia bacterium]|nr:GNAT family N-acetyltransferase [Clostridia bacterium]
MGYETRCVRAKDEEHEEITKFSTEVFSVDFENFLPFIYRKGAPTGHFHFVVRENGELAASVLNYPIKIRVLDRDILAYGVGTLCVREESRGRGYMDDMLAECLLEASREGAVFSVLSGQRQRYGYYGYSVSEDLLSFGFSHSSLRHSIGQRPSNYTLREAKKSDGGTLVGIMKTQKVYVEREPDDFILVAAHDFRKTYLVLEGDKPVGYVVMNRENDSATEVVLVPGAELDELVLALREKFQQSTFFHVPKSEGYLCRKLFREGSDIYSTDEASPSILDFPKVIEAFGDLLATERKVPDGKFVFHIDSHPFYDKIGISKEGVTHGTLEISVKDGKFRVVPTDAEPDVSLPYLRAIELLFTGASQWDRDLPGWAHAILPLPFTIPAADKV